MNNISALVAILLVFRLNGITQAPAESYPIDPASIEQAGVPKGEVLHFTFEHSRIFPGTTRDYWVYVPKQYDAATPACVYVNQDGIQWKAPTVFDNLIFKKEMPVTIGIFVAPGKVISEDKTSALDRFNRSFEYDGLGDNYVRFLLEELLPEVEKKQTSDGRAIHLSTNGNDRAIGGASSGAVCAFTAAWEKPDQFSRVFSAIGTYVGLRGADRYATLIRKYEPKPIRIFLQDGTNDLNIYGGDWWKANETMERALSFSGYEVNHIWGEGQHNGQHGTAVFPIAMRWLWKDWPRPVKNMQTKNQFLADLLIPGEDWKLVGENYTFTEGIAASAKGEVYFQDIPNSKTYVVKNGKPVVLPINAHKASGTCFGADGKRYTTAGETQQIIRYTENNKPEILAENIKGNDLVVAKNGNIYVTLPDGPERPGKILLIKPDGKQLVADSGIKYPNGCTLSPDQTQLYVTESASHWVWVYQIKADGTLSFKQKYGWLHVSDNTENAWSDGLKCDTAGRVFVTSRLGIQILDQLGRVNAMLPLPNGQASNLCFGGENFDTMFVSSRDKIYSRKLRTRGSNPFDAPFKPLPPRM